MNKSFTFLLALFFSFIAITSNSCKKSTLSNLEGKWALVPIGTPDLLGDDGKIQAGWDIWEFTGGTLSISPEGAAKKFEVTYSVSDVFIEKYLILKDVKDNNIPVVQEILDLRREYDQYNTKYTIVKLTNDRMVLFSQKAGGIQREFLRE